MHSITSSIIQKVKRNFNDRFQPKKPNFCYLLTLDLQIQFFQKSGYITSLSLWYSNCVQNIKKTNGQFSRYSKTKGNTTKFSEHHLKAIGGGQGQKNHVGLI